MLTYHFVSINISSEVRVAGRGSPNQKVVISAATSHRARMGYFCEGRQPRTLCIAVERSGDVIRRHAVTPYIRLDPNAALGMVAPPAGSVLILDTSHRVLNRIVGVVAALDVPCVLPIIHLSRSHENVGRGDRRRRVVALIFLREEFVCSGVNVNEQVKRLRLQMITARLRFIGVSDGATPVAPQEVTLDACLSGLKVRATSRSGFPEKVTVLLDSRSKVASHANHVIIGAALNRVCRRFSWNVGGNSGWQSRRSPSWSPGRSRSRSPSRWFGRNWCWGFSRSPSWWFGRNRCWGFSWHSSWWLGRLICRRLRWPAGRRISGFKRR